MFVPEADEPWEITAGDPATLEIVVTEADGSPSDLSGGSWAAQWRQRERSLTAITLTVDASRAGDGELSLLASGVQTAAMGGVGVWDVQDTSLNGTTLVRGKTTYQMDVTR